MGETIEKRLSDLGVTLPVAAAPAANYVPFCRTGNLLFTAGQLPLKDGKLAASGLLGRDVDTAAGKEAAKYCAINILAQAKAALGDLERSAGWSRSPSSSPRHLTSPNSIWSPMAPPISWSRCSASAASMPARPSARPRCRSMPQSKSKRSSKSNEPGGPT